MSKKENTCRAFTLLKKSKSAIDRAEQYTDRIAKSIELKIISNLEQEIEVIEDQIYDLENVNLTTNLNQGIKALTKDEVENNFIKIFELNYNKTILQAKLKVHKETFNHYFGTTKVEKI